MSPTQFPEDADIYLAQLERHLAPLPADDRARIVQEISGHLAERAAVGPDTLHATITGLGAPSVLARSFVDDYRLTGALASGPSWRILLAILPRVWRSLGALVVGTAGVVLYMLTFGFAMVAVFKPLTPGNVGAWRGEHGGISDFGVEFSSVHTTPELLGWWIIPISLAAAAICYLTASGLMRTGGRLLLRR